MATNEILPFAGTTAADNLITQANYLADAGNIRTIGNQPGIADDRLVNKALRQATLIAAAVGKIGADNQATNIVDTLTVTQMAAALLAGLNKAVSQILVVKDIKSAGTQGGASAVNTISRTLNTVEYNTITGASLASNTITLPAGTYKILAFVPSHGINRAKAWLRNQTDSVNLVVGATVDSFDQSAVDPGGNLSSNIIISGIFTLTGTKELTIVFNSDTASVDGLGVGNGVNEEVYTQAEITKIS